MVLPWYFYGVPQVYENQWISYAARKPEYDKIIKVMAQTVRGHICICYAIRKRGWLGEKWIFGWDNPRFKPVVVLKWQ